jgi:phosphoglycerol transferase MdoB-like AlkP superfamily enzyme
VKILAISLLLTAPLLLAARGGWKQIPINASSAHFSHIPVLNDSATNPAWHFTKSVLTYSVFIGRNNPYLSFSAQEKRAYLDLFIKGDRSSQKHEPLVVTNPNIVFLILESWSSDIIKKLGGFKNVTPNFDKLTSDGILFTNFFASGNRSQQGLAALFGGFPALPYGTAAEDTSFTKSMPKLVHHLSTKGYSSHFYYGGQLQFGNIKTLLLYNGFKNLTEEWDLPSNLLRGQMGVHDGPMLDLFLEHINQQQRSHVSAFFSVSTHTPFDIDYDWSPSEGKPTDQRYLVSARYADNELGKFFEHAKSKEWYKNTLFVLVADHSYPTSINSSSFQANYRRIPLLLLGGAISPKLRGTTVSRISSQVDLPATIGTQFGFSQENLKWSRNLFAENFEEYAYYEVNDGAGMVLPHMALRFDSTNGNCYNRQEIQITAEKECFFTKAFVQDLVESFISGSQTHLFNQHKVSY